MGSLLFLWRVCSQILRGLFQDPRHPGCSSCTLPVGYCFLSVWFGWGVSPFGVWFKLCGDLGAGNSLSFPLDIFFFFSYILINLL